MGVQYRQLEEKDILKALALFRKLGDEMAEVSFTEVHEEVQISEWIDNDNTFVYVAADGDLILAVIRAKRQSDENRHAVILTVAVDFQFRGQNLAKDLTLYCLEELKRQGVTIARAYIYSNNYPSVCTILSCGFVSAGCVHRHHYDERSKRFVDDLIFHKVIGE